jgi:hypothetical protein
MKILLFLLLLLFSTANVSAQTVDVQKQIDELKDRIASRVAELKLVEKRGIIGTVTAASQRQITLTDTKGETRFVDVDELTKFNGETRDFGISDIKKDQTLGVLGLYNKQSRRLLARVVTELTIPRYIIGVVESTDEEDFTITVVDAKDKVYVIDYERSTTAFSYTKEDGLERSGFSQIEAGQNTIVSGFSDTLEETRIEGDRILIFPEIPKNPNVAIEVKTSPSPVATPSAR